VPPADWRGDRLARFPVVFHDRRFNELIHARGHGVVQPLQKFRYSLPLWSLRLQHTADNSVWLQTRVGVTSKCANALAENAKPFAVGKRLRAMSTIERA